MDGSPSQYVVSCDWLVSETWFVLDDMWQLEVKLWINHCHYSVR